MHKPLIAIMSAALCLGLTTHLWAQLMNFSADRKITGQFFKPQTARVYKRGATQHAQVLQQYAQQHKALPQETAKEHAGHIRHNVEAAKKEFAKLGPEIKDDAAGAKMLAQIEAHLAKALEACYMCDTACALPHPDGGKVADCCSDMLKELKAADELHEKLLKHFKYVEPGVAQPKPKPSETPKK